MALNWMGGVDHPMADAKAAREIVDGFPGNDPHKTLQEAAEWLGSLNRTDGFRLNRRFDNVRLIEAAARDAHRRLLQDYLSTPRQQKYQENRLWNGAFGYCRQLEDAYIRCVREYDSGFAGITSIGISLPVLIGRALRALTLQLKWGLFRYGPVEPRIWGAIAGLLRLAEERGMADGAILLYQGENGTTVKGEFLKAVMLGASSPDRLLPARQQIAERLIAHFAGGFRVATSPQGCTHGFDLALSRPPVRLFNEAAPTGTMRFFGAGQATAEFDQLAARLAQRREIPSEINLGGSYDPDLVGGVARYLAETWSEKPLVRKGERRQTAGRITVVPGLSEIYRVFKPSAGENLDFSSQASAESWIVDNVSDGGYGAIIPARAGDWIRIGALVGVKNETSENCAIGLVRRITSDEHDQRRVGIQLLTGAAEPVGLSKADTSTSLNFDIEVERAILLSRSPDAEGEVDMLHARGAFKASETLDMTFREQTIRLQPSRLIESGEDFEWAKFKVLGRIA